LAELRAVESPGEKLYPAGKVYHIWQGKVVERTGREFSELKLASSMISDHMPDVYVLDLEALED
jgi:hypothetical protein